MLREARARTAPRPRPRPLGRVTRAVAVRAVSTGALVSFTASCALGAGVATGLVDTRGARWMHHALYLVTATLSAAAASSLFWGAGSRLAPSRLAQGWIILPAGIPLALIPRHRGRSPQHLALAAAAPFITANAVAAWSVT